MLPGASEWQLPTVFSLIRETLVLKTGAPTAAPGSGGGEAGPWLWAVGGEPWEGKRSESW